MSDYHTLLYTVDAGLATITMNRPDRNGMTNRMVREMHGALTRVAADPSVRVLLLTGAGRSFCPGADLNWASSGEDDPEEWSSPEHFQVPVLLHEMPALTIAAVNGACAGAGFGWACGCDIRFAARSAMFNTAFLNVAVAGDMGLPWSLPRLVGAARARQLSFLSSKFDAGAALEMGLVADVFDDDAFADEVDRVVVQLMARSPTALRAMKDHYVAAERMDFGSYVALETERHRRIAASEDTQEAFRAFLEKRPPRFASS